MYAAHGRAVCTQCAAVGAQWAAEAVLAPLQEATARSPGIPDRASYSKRMHGLGWDLPFEAAAISLCSFAGATIQSDGEQ